MNVDFSKCPLALLIHFTIISSEKYRIKGSSSVNRPKPNLKKKGTNTNSNPTIKKSGVRFDLAEHVVTFNKIENASY